MMNTPSAEDSRKPYTPPQATRVELRPQEAVLGFCKNSGFTGPLASSCTILACSTSGS